MQQLSDWLGVSLSTCSRNLTALGDVHRNGKPGLQVVITKPDPADARRMMAFLTPKGKRVATSLLEYLS